MYNLFLLIISLLVFSSSNLQGQSKPEEEVALKNKRNMLQNIADSLFTININNIFVTIDAKVGARIISLEVDGRELLSSKKVNPHFYGSTLWLAPEGKWKGQGVLDNGNYKVVYFNGTDLTLESKRDTLRGFIFSKQFQGIADDTSILIKYTISNISKDVQEVAPWEVTRVPTGGLAFTPKANPTDIPEPNQSYPLLKIIDSLGFIWYPFDSSGQSPQKMFMNGEGWIAYVNNGMLFIKKFPIIKPDQAAPGEKNVEMYVNKEKSYIELENQGVYEKLLPNNSLIYQVKWYARKLPNGIIVQPDDTNLIHYIRTIVE
jgi:hypothetical protein